MKDSLLCIRSDKRGHRHEGEVVLVLPYATEQQAGRLAVGLGSDFYASWVTRRTKRIERMINAARMRASRAEQKEARITMFDPSSTSG